jgi:hypothetical protein
MSDWDIILGEAERLAIQFRRLGVDLSEAEKVGDYYIHKNYSDKAMGRYLELMAKSPPPRSRRSQGHFKNLWDIWRTWDTNLAGKDKARAWGWGVRIAKAAQ